MRLSIAVVIAAIGTLAGACEDQPHLHGDPDCYEWEDSTTLRDTRVNIGLFVNEPFGDPLCIWGADITVVQGRHRTTARRATGKAYWLGDGVHMAESSEDWACNGYVDVIPRTCYPPLEYSVRIEGCDPVDGVFTWDDNLFGRMFDWHLPIKLTCSDPPIDGTITGGEFVCRSCAEPEGGT